LWLAYLAGGGRSSLVYLVRVLEVDPTNQRARAAIRWARARPQAETTVAGPVMPRRRRRPRLRSVLMGLTILLLGLIGGLPTAAFMLGKSLPTPTLVPLIVVVSSATPSPADSPASLSAPDTPTTALAASSTATHTPVVLEPSPSVTVTSTRALTSPSPSPAASYTPEAVAALLPGSPTPTVLPPTAAALPTPFPTSRIGSSFRWIDVDLTHQRVIAYEGDTPVRQVTVSTGLPRTPTVTGRFKIYVKYRAADMSGPGYYLSQVPYVMYFYRGYGLHGTYWHNNFGQPMSHGCVNLPTPEAEWLFNWASVGTLVVVHY
jgi:lipoprotein-anchoring transpeptidase ErfK/SrfK